MVRTPGHVQSDMSGSNASRSQVVFIGSPRRTGSPFCQSRLEIGGKVGFAQTPKLTRKLGAARPDVRRLSPVEPRHDA